MWAAGALEIAQPLVLGLATEKVSSITSVEAKNGRSGPLVFVNLRHELSQRGNLGIIEEQNLVYREAPQERTELPPGESPAEKPAFSREVTPDPVLLFRYSALTYNSHRIHYDREYAVNAELYPALVVHGPLLATLLLDLVYENFPGARISRFKFRAVRPTFDSHPFALCGRRSGNQLLLWSEDHEGYLCMKAEATIAL
jgi:3-methylfumaryl-CoA hydratase